MSSSPPTVVADRYRLVAPLGQGGMGRVWRATDVVLHRDVAIKELVPPPGLTPGERQEMRERSLREARAIARLNNINVVRVFDVLRTDADPWIVMEYVASRSLQDTLAADGPFSPVRAAEMGLGVLNALRAAHRAGVVHRDVKPGNVLIGADGRVVLTDFGLATVPGDPNVTRTGLVLGSPAYIAPERARDGTAGPAADLWSLGATLFAAVEGASPFARPSAIATLAALATENPPPARNAGPLKPVLNGLLRKDPTHRINAEEAERLLLRAAGRRSKLTFPMSPTMRRPGVGRERPALPGTQPTGAAPVVPGPRPPIAPARPVTPPGRPPVSGARPAAGDSRPPVYVPGKAPVGRPSDTPTKVDGPKIDATRVDSPAVRDDFSRTRDSAPTGRRGSLSRTSRGDRDSFTAADVAANRRKQAAPEHERSLADATALLNRIEAPVAEPAVETGDATTLVGPTPPPADATTLVSPAVPADPTTLVSPAGPVDRTTVVSAPPADRTTVVEPPEASALVSPAGPAAAPEATSVVSPAGPAAAPEETSVVSPAGPAADMTSLVSPAAPAADVTSLVSPPAPPADVTSLVPPSKKETGSGAQPGAGDESAAETGASATTGKTAGRRPAQQRKPSRKKGAPAKNVASRTDVTGAKDKPARSEATEQQAAAGAVEQEAQSAADDVAGKAVAASSALVAGSETKSEPADSDAVVEGAEAGKLSESKEEATTPAPAESEAADSTPATPDATEPDAADSPATGSEAAKSSQVEAGAAAGAVDSEAAESDVAESDAAKSAPVEADAAAPGAITPGSVAPEVDKSETSGSETSHSQAAESQSPADKPEPTPPAATKAAPPKPAPAKTGSTEPAAATSEPAKGRPAKPALDRTAIALPLLRDDPDPVPDDDPVPVLTGVNRPSRPAWRPMEIRPPASTTNGVTVFGTRLTYRQAAIGAGIVLLVLVLIVVLVAQAFGDDKPEAQPPAPAATTPSAAATKPSSAPPTSASPSAAPSSAPAGVSLPDGWELYTDSTGFKVPLPKNATKNRSGSQIEFKWDHRLLLIDQTKSPKPDTLADWQEQEQDRAGRDYRNYQKVKMVRVNGYFEQAADWEFYYTTKTNNRQHAVKRNIIVDDNQAYSVSWYVSPEDWDASQSDLKLIYEGFQPRR